MSTSTKSLGRSLLAAFGESEDAGEYALVDQGQIHILPQAREEFEDDTQTLDDLGESLLKRWAQPVVLRPREEGGYWLIAGERRLRAARLKGIAKIPSRIFDVTAEEAEELQDAENIHRKNLTQLEQAKRLQKQLDELGGDKKALLAKLNKNAVWLSKNLALLDLGPQTKRLIAENITADTEVIGAMRQIEKRDPVLAKATIAKLATRESGERARDVVNAAKDTVKPPSKAKQERAARAPAGGGSVATPPDKSHEQPSTGKTFNAFGAFGGGSSASLKKPGDAATDVQAQSPSDQTPLQALEDLSDVERKKVEKKLRSHYQDGRDSTDYGRDLIRGLRDGTFGTQGEASLRLAAFTQGIALVPEFDLAACMDTVKP